MNAGIILLSWAITAVVFVVLLVASGMLTIHVEIIDKDERKKKRDPDEDSED